MTEVNLRDEVVALRIAAEKALRSPRLSFLPGSKSNCIPAVLPPMEDGDTHSGSISVAVSLILVKALRPSFAAAMFSASKTCHTVCDG